jgi:hypothetical protein
VDPLVVAQHAAVPLAVHAAAYMALLRAGRSQVRVLSLLATQWVQLLWFGANVGAVWIAVAALQPNRA